VSTRDAYKQKIEAELDLAQAKLVELKAKAEISAADARINFARLTDDLEKSYDATKLKLKELDESRDDAWEMLKEGVEKSWGELKQAVGDASAKFKG
jgi:hypothetical protein